MIVTFVRKLISCYIVINMPTLLILLLPIAVANASIIQIHAIFRHGQRTPADTYPNDPYKDHDFAPFGWGQLTNDGKRQQYEQGQFLRTKYNDFFGDKFCTSEVEARATGVDRTRMSLQLMMAGLYPPKGDQIWNENLAWQPVPYSSQQLNDDTLLLVRSCPRYQEALDHLLAENEVIKTELEKEKELYSYLHEHSGMKVSNPDDVQDIYSTLKAEEGVGLKLPEWTQTVYPEKMADVTAFSFVLNAYNKELQKIKAGPLLHKIIDEAEKKAAGSSKKKFLAYAGHDSTISNLGMAMGVWHPQIPVYNIMFIMEVHDLEGKPGIKIMLRNTTEHEPFELTIPGCEPICPLEQMTTILKDVIPTESKDSMCAPKDTGYKPPLEGGP